jgi:hypothetical protein
VSGLPVRVTASTTATVRRRVVTTLTSVNSRP